MYGNYIYHIQSQTINYVPYSVLRKIIITNLWRKNTFHARNSQLSRKAILERNWVCDRAALRLASRVAKTGIDNVPLFLCLTLGARLCTCQRNSGRHPLLRTGSHHIPILTMLDEFYTELFYTRIT